MRPITLSSLDRTLLAFAFQQVEVDPNTQCWLWPEPLNDDGYGVLLGQLVHRLSYIFHKGPIPPGLVIDHTCVVRRCCNPEHLEACTSVQNTRRAIERGQQSPDQRVHNGARAWCKHGHRFDVANTGYEKNGKRYCKRCRLVWAEQLRRRRGQAVQNAWRVDLALFLAMVDTHPGDLDEAVLSTRAACEYLGISRAVLTKWLQHHPEFRPPGYVFRQHMRWPQSHLDRLLASKTRF